MSTHLRYSGINTTKRILHNLYKLIINHTTLFVETINVLIDHREAETEEDIVVYSTCLV